MGAHRPTKMPNLSAWARDSGASPLAMYQISIDPIMEAKPAKKQREERDFLVLGFMKQWMLIDWLGDVSRQVLR